MENKNLTNPQTAYLPPVVEYIEIAIESGFAVTGNAGEYDDVEW